MENYQKNSFRSFSNDLYATLTFRNLKGKQAAANPESPVYSNTAASMLHPDTGYHPALAQSAQTALRLHATFIEVNNGQAGQTQSFFNFDISLILSGVLVEVRGKLLRVSAVLPPCVLWA